MIPRLAERALERLIVDDRVRDDVLGDLAEDFTAVAVTEGPGAARRWYWRQAARTAPSLVRAAIPRGLDGLRLLAAVTGGYLAMASLVMLADQLIALLQRAGALSPTETAAALTSLPLSFGCGVMGGFAAGRLASRMVGRAALSLGVVSFAIGVALLASWPAGVPSWYPIALLVIVVPATVLGGRLARPSPL